jgi:NAD(P)-dependent dehydrogenase (short-subunit alcohol dehydrogenase family)
MSSSDRSVLVTGASSGIGKTTALHLDALGLRVFAGVRRETDGRALQDLASDRLSPILLDVTEPDAIEHAVRTIGEATSGELHGLVNNAGLSLNGPLELVPVSEMRKLMDVNVLGLLAVTQAFLPLLRRARGRILNVSSGHGLLAIPDKSVYAASKFAVQAVCDALRVELRPFGVSVSSVVVGKVDTEVLGKIESDRARMLGAAAPDIVSLYAPLLDFFDREVRSLPGVEPEVVARVAGKALTEKRPRAQYLVGPGARKMRNLARLPVRLRDRLLYSAIYGKRRR